DAKLWTLSPGLAWRDPSLRGGAELASIAAGPLRDAGLGAGDIVVEVEGKPVVDAAGFLAAAGSEAERLAETGGALHLGVKSGDGPPRAFTITVPKKAAAPAGGGPAGPRSARARVPRAARGGRG